MCKLIFGVALFISAIICIGTEVATSIFFCTGIALVAFGADEIRKNTKK